VSLSEGKLINFGIKHKEN